MVREEQILKAIKEFYIENGCPPTIRELCKITNLKSTSSIAVYIDRLKLKGEIIPVGKSYTVKGIKISFDE